MSQPAARLTDICSGHSCYPPRPNIQGSEDVFFNNLPAHRQMDKWMVHTCHSTHDGFLAMGSQTVFTNGKQQGRVMDPVSCGSKVATGSPDIFIG